MSEARTLFQEDTAAHRVARALGFELVRRYRKVEITDEKALAAAGYLSAKPKPDYQRITQALDAGECVEGARWSGTEYILRPAGGGQ